MTRYIKEPPKYVSLIGFPLRHSISAVFQQAAFKYYGLNYKYQNWETEPSKLRETLEKLRHPEMLGANVTVPHKEAVMQFLDSLEKPVHQIGAVNTILVTRGKGKWILEGHNTDYSGFLRALKDRSGFDPKGKRAVILGAGGAARAVSFALIESGIIQLTIVNRTGTRAEALAQALPHEESQRLLVQPWEENTFRREFSSCDLVVNCTTIGMKHSVDEGRSPLEARFITKNMLVCDLVYNPLETPLLRMAKAAGARTLAGLPMLIYQGAAAFELWTGRQAPVDIMFQAARKALEA